MRSLRATMVGVALAAAAAPASAAGAPALNAAGAPQDQLVKEDTVALPGGASLDQYSQVVGGIPVDGAAVVVADGVGAPPRIATDSSVAGLKAPGSPAVARAGAVAAALAAIGSPLGGATSAELVIDAQHANQLVWKVTHSDARPISDRLVTVSAADGSVLASEDLLRQVTETGTAQLFVPNPVVSTGSYSGLKDKQDADSAALTAARIPVTLEDIKDGKTCLNGHWAHARYTRDRKKVCNDTRDWSSRTRAKPKFEALMAYHHITEVQRYIRDLGFSDVNAESQKVIANTISEDNSFFSPSRDEIQLGTGGVDDGEDADVIVHEYGHAVQHDQAGGAFNGQQGGAMGEGFGDYLAAAYSTKFAGFHSEWTPCVMEWDATSYDFSPDNGICLRRADDPSSLSAQANQCQGGAANIHCMGQVWASALLKLRQDLGDDGGGDSIMDKAVIASHDLLAGSANASFAKAAKAVIDADEMLYPAADHCSALRDEFVARELLTLPPPC